MVVNGVENIEMKNVNEDIIERIDKLSKKNNKQLNKSKEDKYDEFYTQSSDIESELKYYKEHFKERIVFCNCDDPESSEFWKYFCRNFKHLGLKKVISTHYDRERSTYKLEYDGKNIITTDLKENGDFRSPECIELLKESDIIVTNPPFSLFREYIAQLIEYNKKFIIIGDQNAFSSVEIFPLLRENKIWIGYNCRPMNFRVPYIYTKKFIEKDGIKYRSLGTARWFTNFEVKRRHEDLTLYKKYNKEEYLKYDNYDAINVNFVKNIPKDYDGLIGVPLSFIDKHNPDQFEIIGSDVELTKKLNEKSDRFYLNGVRKYARIVIKKVR